MCDHCGCRELTPVARLMAEHDRLRELTAAIRADLAAQDDAAAEEHLGDLLAVLGPHVQREEFLLFPALREHDELAAHVAALAADHADLYDDVDALDDAGRGPEWRRRLLAILVDLGNHMFEEDFGLFPAALAALEGSDWDRIEAAGAAVTG